MDVSGFHVTGAGLVLALSLVVGWGDAGAEPDDRPVIDPDVRAAVASGPQRVLVELRVATSEPSAIERAQDDVMRGLAGTGTSLARRYTTAPLLALEIDAAALARLEAMRGLVKRVRVDRLARPNDDSTPRH